MRNLFIPLFIVALIVAVTSLFIVQQGDRGVVLRFGKVITDSDNLPIIYDPGLHFKMPFIDSVKMLDARIQTLSIPVSSFITNEQKQVLIDSYIKWQITDFSLFYRATNGGVTANIEMLLKSKFNDRLRSAVGERTITDLVTDSRGQVMDNVRQELNSGVNKDGKMSAVDREIVEAAARAAASSGEQVKTDSKNLNSMSALGINIVDVRIKQISLPGEVFEAIYNRMREERRAVAEQHRAQGKEQAEKNKALADYLVTKTIAGAEKESRVIRGGADAEAAKIFADAFSKDSEFYTFIRSLKAYENSFRGNKDMLVIQPDSEFFRYMLSPTAKAQ